jgi:NAD(P)-dependent dehydrogenase (short-subunit alcohol dehydrogenase family)
VITGGSRGIGAATAAAAAREGWDVVLSYRERADAAGRVVAAVQSIGRTAVAVRADVADETDVGRLFDAAAELGHVEAVVNNAGVVPSAGSVASYDSARLTALVRVNVVGAFLVAAEAVRRLSIDNGGAGGVIVNVSSRAAILGSSGEYVDYAATKAAVDTLTLGLSREVAGDGIRVVGVRPGLIETEIHAPGRLDRLGTSPPLGRPGRPEEVAAAIVWLMSDAASYVTGATLDVSGGR